MKTTIGTLAMLGAVLLASSTLAQTAQSPRCGPAPAPGTRSTTPTPPVATPNLALTNGIGGTGGGRYAFNQPRPPVAAATGTVPAGQGQGQGTAALPTSPLGGPVNGERGFGGGRTATAGPSRDHIDQDALGTLGPRPAADTSTLRAGTSLRVINNSESDTCTPD